jgi:hypothetical protein
MQSDPQSDQPKRRRKPKVKSARANGRRGGDHTSLKFRREQAQIDGQVYRLIAEGFQLAQAAAALGINEDACGHAYQRALASLRLATVAEAKSLALDRIHYRRSILYAEIQKRVRANGSDEKKLLDSGDLRALFDAANQLDVRESRLIGLDAPLRSLVAWAGMPANADLLTTKELDNLNDDQLRVLHALLDIARGNGDGGEVIVASSRHISEPPVFMPEPVAAEYRENTEQRERDMDALTKLHDQLADRDPVTAIGDPVARRALAAEYNQLAARFGAPMWTEPNGSQWVN